MGLKRVVSGLSYLLRGKKNINNVPCSSSLPVTKRQYNSANFKIIPGNAQHIGAREEQQDAFGFSDLEDARAVANTGVLVVIADGMGGLAMGREASNLAVRIMLEEYAGGLSHEAIPEALYSSLHKANNAVLSMAKEAGLEGEVGTTLAAAVIYNGELYWISAGDSRIYLFRAGQLIKLTTEHVFARELINEAAKGSITLEEALSHPDRNALTSYLGVSSLQEIDQNIRPFKLQPGDYIVLCSDGLYGTLTEPELMEIMHGNPQHVAELLVQQALAKGKKHQDNVTVAILACV